MNSISKSVLVLSSSPRKGGNSDLLCDQFVSGALVAGHQVEKVCLKDKNIRYCTGCGTCFNRTTSCSQKDDMAEILGKMVEADVIVMATPVYFYTMCAQMKTLIDRTCARYTEISDKDFYFIVTAAISSSQALQRTIEEFRGFTSCLENSHEKGIVFGTGAWNVGDIRQSNAMRIAYDMGETV